MTLQEFKQSLLIDTPPDGLGDLLTALWYDGKGKWEKSHHIVQDINSKGASWIHAYLHRKEGDVGNASYWYHRAGKNMPTVSLDEEWEGIVRSLL
jgi:hypothetical protein